MDDRRRPFRTERSGNGVICDDYDRPNRSMSRTQPLVRLNEQEDLAVAPLAAPLPQARRRFRPLPVVIPDLSRSLATGPSVPFRTYPGSDSLLSSRSRVSLKPTSLPAPAGRGLPGELNTVRSARFARRLSPGQAAQDRPTPALITPSDPVRITLREAQPSSSHRRGHLLPCRARPYLCAFRTPRVSRVSSSPGRHLAGPAIRRGPAGPRQPELAPALRLSRRCSRSTCSPHESRLRTRLLLRHPRRLAS